MGMDTPITPAAASSAWLVVAIVLDLLPIGTVAPIVIHGSSGSVSVWNAATLTFVITFVATAARRSGPAPPPGTAAAATSTGFPFTATSFTGSRIR